MSAWVYIQTEPQLWTVGFYSPHGDWYTDSDWDNRDDARARVHMLNGGTNHGLLVACKQARAAIASLDNDALGIASGRDEDGGEITWPIRDELLSKLDKAIAQAE